MKFNLDSVLSYLRKNKYVVFFIFILFVAFFHLSIFRGIKRREGLEESGEVGEYDYLAPPPEGNSWSDEIWHEFVNKHNFAYCPTGQGNLLCMTFPVHQETKNEFYKYTTEPEILYYIKHGVFPYNNYVKTYVSQLNIENGVRDRDTEDLQIHYSQKFIPNRLFYEFIIAPKESKINQEPLSYQIFTGKVRKPGL